MVILSYISSASFIVAFHLFYNLSQIHFCMWCEMGLQLSATHTYMYPILFENLIRLLHFHKIPTLSTYFCALKEIDICFYTKRQKKKKNTKLVFRVCFAVSLTEAACTLGTTDSSPRFLGSVCKHLCFISACFVHLLARYVLR